MYSCTRMQNPTLVCDFVSYTFNPECEVVINKCALLLKTIPGWFSGVISVQYMYLEAQPIMSECSLVVVCMALLKIWRD